MTLNKMRHCADELPDPVQRRKSKPASQEFLHPQSRIKPTNISRYHLSFIQHYLFIALQNKYVVIGATIFFRVGDES